jgi:hypothetical protein
VQPSIRECLGGTRVTLWVEGLGEDGPEGKKLLDFWGGLGATTHPVLDTRHVESYLTIN